MKSSLEQAIKNTISISQNELDFMIALFQPLTLKKEQFFLEVGKQCHHIAFVKTGMLRIFYPNDKGEHTTCHFSLPGDFITSLSSFNNQKPSTENIQAILPAELLVIDRKGLDVLYEKVPAMQEFVRKTAENVAMNMEKRIALFLNNSADERYQHLLKSNPALIQTVPLQYLASYIGISPQHLSRLRKNI